MISVASPHDEFFKAVFSDPAHAAELVRLAAHGSSAPRIESRSLRLLPGSFIEPPLREIYSDLLFEARLGAARSLVYVLFEHKSSPEHLTLLQLYRYMGAIWERPESRPVNTLPRIIPIVVYHGNRTWRVPRTFGEYFAEDPSGLDEVGPELRPLFLDLSEVADALLPRASPAVRAALLAMRHAFRPGATDVSAILNPAITEIVTEAARQFFFALGTYLMRTSTGEERRVILQIVTAPRAREVVMTIAEELQREGALRDRQEVLVRLLTKKFGLTDGERSLIERTTDTERLTAALDEILVAGRKEQVLEKLGR